MRTLTIFLVVWLERRRRFKAALAYNRQYTFAYSGPHAETWMCPTCCTIHRSQCHSKFTGPQFAACCEFEAGGRKERRHAISFRR
jgi:hypothetical protein